MARDGLSLRYIIDTHTHADHFSAARQMGEAFGAPVVMHREAPAHFVSLRVDDGDMLLVGKC